MKFFADYDVQTYEKQSKVALAGLLAELPNLLVSLIDAFFANTLLVWSDSFTSFGSTLHYLMVFFAARKMKKEAGDRYNFGLERLETFVSFICNLLIATGYLTLIGVSVYNIIHPSQPESALGLFLILKIINIAFDTYFYVSQIKIRKKHKSRMNETETENCLNNLIIDAATGIVACFCFFLRAYRWAWYISPVVVLIMTSVFLYRCVRQIRGAIDELSDASISIGEQDELFDIVLHHASDIEKVYGVNCRMMNGKLYVEIDLVFKDSIPFSTQQELLEKIDADIKKHFTNSITRFIIECR